ncbi:winged helix-turn-helix transcriptional regulator [Breznakiella homolactica]|uniref:Helix-turn-helix transcriptional regulator n=1 Tax=Breznakiella homolactica TaxID=2798577 RepID=A0A7T7XK13_9SPIR|nr:helix-turn-helix domain-containing protein [Breznakiella homolactica]QQO07662.1 helix-turn-helix transcriptional regulator [Breznakiella homolactica]
MKERVTFEEYVKIASNSATESGNCPVSGLLLMLQGKWKNQIIYAMSLNDTIRFGKLKKEVPGITNTMLTNTLRELEADGLIHREQFNEIPPHVEYSLTEKGRNLFPIFYEMLKWGLRYAT